LGDQYARRFPRDQLRTENYRLSEHAPLADRNSPFLGNGLHYLPDKGVVNLTEPGSFLMEIGIFQEWRKLWKETVNAFVSLKVRVANIGRKFAVRETVGMINSDNVIRLSHRRKCEIFVVRQWVECICWWAAIYIPNPSVEKYQFGQVLRSSQPT